MTNPIAQRLRGELDELYLKAMHEQRDLTDAEAKRVDGIKAEAIKLKSQAAVTDAMKWLSTDGTEGTKPEGWAFKSNDEPTLGAPPLTFERKQIDELFDAATKRQMHTVQAKATISGTQAPMSQAIQYDFTEWPFLRDAARILDLIPVKPASGSKIDYFRATTGATAAAAVAEGAAKPESSPVWAEVVANVSKIAHFVRVNDEVISDHSNFLDIIGREMLSGLLAAENEQLLNGSGVAPNLLGLLNTTGILTRARTTESNLDVLFDATTDLRTGSSFVEPDVIVMHPNNFGSVRKSKDANGAYITGDPMGAPPFVLWGAKVLVTNRIAAGTSLVANLKESSVAYLREPARLEVNGYGGTAEFIQNQSLIRAEERLALAVVRPSALCRVTGLA